MKIYPAAAEVEEVPTATMPTAGATQCEGRLVRDGPKGEWMLPFQGEEGDGAPTTTWFHVPIRCERVGVVGGLCTTCYERDVRTQKKMEGMRGTTIGAVHPSLLHGRIGEPVPFWSHIIGGAWFNLKLEAGYRVHEGIMARAKQAIEAAEGVGAVLKGEPVPAGTAKRGRKPKTDAAVAPAPVAAEPATVPPKPVLRIQEHLQRAAAFAESSPTASLATQPTASPLATTPPPKKVDAGAAGAAKKRGPKKVTAVGAGAPTPSAAHAVATGYVEHTRASPVDDVVEITVRRLELDGGRSYYLDPKKQKVYDMKCKYVGRYSAETREIDRSFPDSDAEH